MHPASPVSVQRISVFSLLLAFFALASLASGQTGTVSKHKVSQHQPLLATAVAVRPTKKNAPPPVTTDTWNGGGGSNTDWSDNSNWTNGAPSGQNVVIGPSAFSTVGRRVQRHHRRAPLTLSGSGDLGDGRQQHKLHRRRQHCEQRHHYAGLRPETTQFWKSAPL